MTAAARRRYYWLLIGKKWVLKDFSQGMPLWQAAFPPFSRVFHRWMWKTRWKV
jgi:hypothetical protein